MEKGYSDAELTVTEVCRQLQSKELALLSCAEILDAAIVASHELGRDDIIGTIISRQGMLTRLICGLKGTL